MKPETKRFLRARQMYWRATLRRYKPDHPMGSDDEIPPAETRLVVAQEGPLGLFGVFEDEGDTGYLYLYDPHKSEILDHVHIYDRLTVRDEDVEVLWSSSGRKVGVAIIGGVRGIIDLDRERPRRCWMKSLDSLPIEDRDWLEGFPVPKRS